MSELRDYRLFSAKSNSKNQNAALKEQAQCRISADSVLLWTDREAPAGFTEISAPADVAKLTDDEREWVLLCAADTAITAAKDNHKEILLRLSDTLDRLEDNLREERGREENG